MAVYLNIYTQTTHYKIIKSSLLNQTFSNPVLVLFPIKKTNAKLFTFKYQNILVYGHSYFC